MVEFFSDFIPADFRMLISIAAAVIMGVDAFFRVKAQVMRSATTAVEGKAKRT
jgi:hypothetical protein